MSAERAPDEKHRSTLSWACSATGPFCASPGQLEAQAEGLLPGNTPRVVLDAFEVRHTSTKDAFSDAGTSFAMWRSKAGSFRDDRPSLTAASSPEGVDLELCVGNTASPALDTHIGTNGVAFGLATVENRVPDDTPRAVPARDYSQTFFTAYGEVR